MRPGGGPQGNLGTIGAVLKLWGRDTDGAVSIVAHPFPAGALVPPHLHTRDEYSIITEGQIGFRSGDREVVLGPGGRITKPRGESHTMLNAGETSARMIEVISPARFEHFFRETVDLTAAGFMSAQVTGGIGQRASWTGRPSTRSSRPEPGAGLDETSRAFPDCL